MLLLKAKHYDELKAKIDAVRAKYPMKRSDIEYSCETIRREIVQKSTPIDFSALVLGRRYGQLSFSPMATAFAGGKGRELRFHGDIYILSWTYAGQGFLQIKDAWGGITTRNVQMMKEPLIELP